jgi:tetratricopeptide (TPR) repeat protein
MADKKATESQEEPQVSKQKTPEQIAAELVGNSRKPVIFAVLTVVILGVVLAIGSSVQKKKQSEAADRYEKLDAIVLGDKSAPASNDAASLKEKITKLDALIAAYPNTKAAVDAQYYKGKFQYDSGNFAEASKTFEEFYGSNPDRIPFTEYARLGAANAKMNLGTKAELEGALKQLEGSLTAVSDTRLQDKIRYQMGLCNAMLGDDEKAKTILKELAEKQDPSGLPSSQKEAAERLMGLMRLAKKDEIAKLAKEFPASQVKVTPPKPKKEDDKKGADKAKAPANK